MAKPQIAPSLAILARWPVMLLPVLVVSCSAPESSPPQQVQSSNPTVTYQYRGDEELIKASESAGVFCGKYKSSARIQGISDTQDGGKSAVFECAANAATAMPGPALAPGQAYPYVSDQDLVDRTRNADSYCSSIGGHHALSTVVPNRDGTKSVSFTCSSS